MVKNILLGVSVVVALVFGVLYFNSLAPVGASGIGPTHWMTENFLQGFYAGTTGQFSVSNAGVMTTSGGLTNSGTLTQSGAAAFTSTVTLGSGGTAINKYLCGTNTTFDPGALTSSTDSYATTSVTVAGAAVGDVVLVTLSTSTSSDVWSLEGHVTTAGQVNVILTANGALNLTTTTVKACVIN